MSQDLQYLEIEHKFVVEPGFDPKPLLDALRQRSPEKIIQADVQDTYFLLEQVPLVVYRHRLDRLLQQLTVKSLGADSEVRLEVNLDLSLSCGNQVEGVRAFLAPLGILWQGSLHKTVEAFYFPDAELVFYEATYAGKTIYCFEIEARKALSIEAGKAVLARWEQELGLLERQRSLASLLELLVVPTLSAELQARVRAMRG